MTGCTGKHGSQVECEVVSELRSLLQVAVTAIRTQHDPPNGWLQRAQAAASGTQHVEPNGKRCFACGGPVSNLTDEQQGRLNAAMAGLSENRPAEPRADASIKRCGICDGFEGWHYTWCTVSRPAEPEKQS